MRVSSWLAAAGVVIGSVLTVSASGLAAAPADTPPPLVEDFSYPGADAILAQHGLKLFSGDGHILFVDSRDYDEGTCPVGQVQVERSLDVEPYGKFFCFRTVGTTGVLTLEVPTTFGVRGGTTAIQATAQLPEGDKTYDVPPNTPVAIDPGDEDELPKAVLVELRMGS